MDRGIYAATSGGQLNSRRIDIVANNLANVNTVGFKAERLVSREKSFADTLAGSLPITEAEKGSIKQVPEVTDVGTTTDFSPGPVSNTGNALNVALLNPNQFFVVQTPTGEMYTRAGNFSLNAERTLVTADGLPVLGDGGPISLPPAGEARIATNGAVTAGGVTIAKLRVAQIDDLKQLQRSDGVRFKLGQGAQPQTVEPAVIPESVEMPNVQIVQAMIDMVNTQRAFEAYTKTTRTLDELNDRSVRNMRNS